MVWSETWITYGHFGAILAPLPRLVCNQRKDSSLILSPFRGVWDSWTVCVFPFFFSSSSARHFFSHRLENTLSIFGIGSRNFGGYSRSHIVLYDWEWLRNHSLFDRDLANWEFKLNRAVVGDAFYTAFSPNSTPCWLFSFRTLVLLPKIFTRGGVSSFFVLIWIKEFELSPIAFS